MGERKFMTELVGAEVRTADGKSLGKLNDFVVDTLSGEIKYLLLQPFTDKCGSMRTDPQGRKIAEFKHFDMEGGDIVIHTK